MKGYVNMTVEQVESLDLLVRYHGTGPSIWQIENGHLEVEHSFPSRYLVMRTGEIHRCNDVFSNRYTVKDIRERLKDAVAIIER